MQPEQPIQPQPVPQQPQPMQPQPVFTQPPAPVEQPGVFAQQPAQMQQPAFVQPQAPVQQPAFTQPQAFPSAPAAFPQQSFAPGPIGSSMNQGFQPPQAHGSKLWIWLVAIGVPVVAVIGVAIYLLIPKGSATAWCETQYKMTQEIQTVSISSGSDSDKKAALAKARDYIKQLQGAAPSDIKKDVDLYAAYTNRFLDAYEAKMANENTLSLSAGASMVEPLPTPTPEESAANTNLMNYTTKTCTSNGKVKTN